MVVTDPKRRFSGRVENYARYRPGYPEEVRDFLQKECGFTGGWTVADVASGTGLLAELFLENGNRVFGVEPNEEMRAAGEHYLSAYPSFTSVAGTAEDTTLEGGAADLVVVGQAFHWFDPGSSREEFIRILRPRGWVALLWNEQRKEASPFLAAYERLLDRYKMEEYEPFDLRSEVRAFFGSENIEVEVFENRQTFDLAGIEGRLLSSSYVPDKDHPNHGAMMEDLEKIFHDYQEGGRVSVEYDTPVYLGRLW